MYAKKIYDSGYPGKIIIQERIFDDFKDGYITEPISSVLTTYSNREGKVVRAVLGDVLLEEKSQTARGNYSSIITKPIDSFSKKIIAMLDKLGYIGIANFDILNFKGKQICLELNARAAGVNLASMLIKDMSGIFTEKTYEYKEILWTAAPIKCLNGEAIEKRLLPRAKTVFLKNGYSSPFDSELDRGIIRRIYLLVHEMRQMRIFERQSKEVIKCSLPKS